MKHQFFNYLLEKGFSDTVVKDLWLIALLLLLIIGCFAVDFIGRKILVNIISKILKKTKNTWDDKLIEKKVFDSLAHIFPAAVIIWFIPVVLEDFPAWISFFLRIAEAYIIIIITIVLASFLNAINSILKESNPFKDKPMESYFQLAKIVVYVVSGVFVLSILLQKSPFYFLSAFGAMTAIVLLIFKDTILGFVASVQISALDMVRVNDWIQMDKYEADGDVISISLNTIKVRNWDNTITTIPTYALVSDSFKNWRGMQETGGRRIKRNINIRMSSIKYCDAEMLEKFNSIELLKTYIADKNQEINNHNLKLGANKNNLINGRNITNIGLFRAYTQLYLKQNPNIHSGMTLMVRQMEPTEVGVPIQIYCFTNTVVWVDYEAIQSDIFDHLLAAVSKFELEILEFEMKVR